MKLSDYVAQFISGIGVRHVFMLPGGGAMHLNDSIGKNKKIKYICSLHEQAAAISASAYSEYTNHLGVAIVTTGPGGTNTITGVTASWLDSIPVLFISGQVKTADCMKARNVRQMGFQEVDIVSLVTPITKYAVTITDPESIRFHLEKAVYLAKIGRPGPVWIDLPLDIQAAEIEPENLRGFMSNEIKISKPSPELIQKTIALINESKYPVILVGNGVRLSGALKQFLDLLHVLQFPVLTTWKSIDFLPDKHPLYVGRPGGVGQRGANFVQQTSDLILILGARLDLGQTAYNHQNFAPHAKKIMVDVDEFEIKKMETNIDLPIVSDVGFFISGLLLHKDKIKIIDRNNWLKHCKILQKKYPVVLPEYWKQKKFVNDYVLIDVLSEEMSKNDLFIPGSSGACSERSMQAFRVKKGMRVFNSEALGSMGFGIPMAIGACIASKNKNTISIEGDGGFIMNIHELEVVRRLNLPIKFFILNNEGYVSIKTSQNNYFQGRFVACNKESGLTLPNYKKIAKAFGIPSLQISNHKDIRSKIKKILKYNGPLICEVLVSPDQVTQPRVSSKKMPDGKMVTMPMEDLWPFLDRKEFAENMKLKVD